MINLSFTWNLNFLIEIEISSLNMFNKNFDLHMCYILIFPRSYAQQWRVKPVQVLLDLNPFINFLLCANIDVVRDISCRVSQREVFPKVQVTRVSPGEREQAL